MPRCAMTPAGIAWMAFATAALLGCGREPRPGSAKTAAVHTSGRAPVEGGTLEYATHSEGEPVLLIHGSHVADAFLPLVAEPALAGYRLILYHRRGFAGSAPHDGPFSIQDQADDARAVLRHLGIARAHVVGHSYGAVTALQLAYAAPQSVQSLTLLEPPLLMVPSARQTGAALARAIEFYGAGNPAAAVAAFMERIGGAEWRAVTDRAVPGGTEQAIHDAATFFEVELPALGEWQFDSLKASTIPAPVLYVTGSESGVFAEEGRELAMRWFPQGQSEVIDGATHLLQVQQPGAVARTLAAFLSRHPLESH